MDIYINIKISINIINIVHKISVLEKKITWFYDYVIKTLSPSGYFAVLKQCSNNEISSWYLNYDIIAYVKLI